MECHQILFPQPNVKAVCMVCRETKGILGIPSFTLIALLIGVEIRTKSLGASEKIGNQNKKLIFGRKLGWPQL